MDFNSLIGLKEAQARQFLIENGYNNIETISNFKNTENCDSVIVCAVRCDDKKITLICGKFFLEI